MVETAWGQDLPFGSNGFEWPVRPSVPIQKFLRTSGLHVEGTVAEALDRGQNVVG
jgi:hypothetical protein